MRSLSLMAIFSLCILAPIYGSAQWSFKVAGDVRWCAEKIDVQSSWDVPPYDMRTKSVVLPTAAVHVDYRLSQSFFMRSGVVIDGKGARFTVPQRSTGADNILFRRTYFYLDVPILILATPELFHARRLYAGIGPFIGYGLTGWLKDEDASTHQVFIKTQISFRGENGKRLKDFDSGVDFLLGYRLLKRFSIQLMYQYGLMNIYNGLDDAYNRSLGIGIDYKVQ